MNALILSLSHWHAGFLGCYGNDWMDTTALDRLASAGVVFDQHFADVPDPATARRTWRTGRHYYPGETETPSPHEEGHPLPPSPPGEGPPSSPSPLAGEGRGGSTRPPPSTPRQ